MGLQLRTGSNSPVAGGVPAMPFRGSAFELDPRYAAIVRAGTNMNRVASIASLQGSRAAVATSPASEGFTITHGGESISGTYLQAGTGATYDLHIAHDEGLAFYAQGGMTIWGIITLFSTSNTPNVLLQKNAGASGEGAWSIYRDGSNLRVAVTPASGSVKLLTTSNSLLTTNSVVAFGVGISAAGQSWIALNGGMVTGDLAGIDFDEDNEAPIRFARNSTPASCGYRFHLLNIEPGEPLPAADGLAILTGLMNEAGLS